MTYVDGFVLPVPKHNVERYREMATLAGEVWREHGALQYCECIAEDVKSGKKTSFPQSVHLEPDEVVVFSWIVFESRAHRDEVNQRAMEDPRLKDMRMPFDGQRMIYGGFEKFVDV